MQSSQTWVDGIQLMLCARECARERERDSMLLCFPVQFQFHFKISRGIPVRFGSFLQ